MLVGVGEQTEAPLQFQYGTATSTVQANTKEDLVFV